MAINFNELNGGAVKSDITYMKLENGDNTFRILPDSILPSYQFWVKNAEGKSKPFDSVQFDRTTERFDNSKQCAVRDFGITDPKTGKPVNPKWSYRCKVINKATGKIEVLTLKKGILDGVLKVAKQLTKKQGKPVDPTSVEDGIWFTVEKEKTGTKAWDVAYTLDTFSVEQTPLTEAELALLEDDEKTIEEQFPVQTYEQVTTALNKHMNGTTEDGTNDKSTDDEAVSELG